MTSAGWLLLALALVGIVFAARYRRRPQPEPSASSPPTTERRIVSNQIDFEFGETNAAQAFWSRNATFWPAFGRLIALTNKCFGRAWAPHNRVQDVAFHLGETCRQDFLEICFLAVNGHGVAAQKLLRGLYERSVTLEYIRQNPDRVERFVDYAAIQEFKAAKKARELFAEQLDAMLVRIGTSFEQLKERHDKVKDQFQVTRCQKCGARDLAISWDLDMTSMVNKIGEPYKTLFLSGYTLPTLQGHATLASAFSSDAREQVDDRRIHDAESSLIFATLVFIAVLQSQNKTFALGFDQQIADCWEEVSTVWKDRPHGPMTPTP
jgi:hypothetical protein